MTALFGTACNKETRRETARRLLARAAFLTWGWTDLPPIARTERGKPYFPDFPAHHFNLSHTDGLCLCALSDAGEVGVDAETVRPHRPDFPRYVLNDEEFAAFDGTWEDFARLWSLKEAHAKYEGGSIYPPRAVPAHPSVPHRSYAGEGWRAAWCGIAPPEDILWVELPTEVTAL